MNVELVYPTLVLRLLARRDAAKPNSRQWRAPVWAR
jgi:hypothetical protein